MRGGRRLRKWKRHRGPEPPSPLNQYWLIWRGYAASSQYSQPHCLTSSQAGSQQTGVPPRAAAAASVEFKNLCPWWRPQRDLHELGCAMTRTHLPYPFRLGRTRGNSSQGRSSPPCAAMFFARTGICAGCSGRTLGVKACRSPPPLRRKPPLPIYLKWIGGNERGACSLAAAGHIPPPNPGLAGIELQR